MAEAVRNGYASSSTDTGHVSTDTAWLLDRQRIIDYGYRAIHEMTVKAKAVIETHYGRAAEYSYFNGCSTGGRQGLMTAQRFPDDYDGIVSGAPVFRFTNLHMGQLWTSHATLKKPGAVLTREDFTRVGEAAVAQCDAHDGVKDGIITDPQHLQLRSEQAARLQARADRGAEVDLPRRGESAHGSADLSRASSPAARAPQPGNPGWGMIMNGTTPFAIDNAVLGAMGLNNPNWDWKTFDFDRDVALINAKLAGTLNAVNPDLSDFKKGGGKLIVWHGWNDPGVMPQQTLDYFADVVDYAGKSTGGDGAAYTDEYLRLFMLPGVGHCRGGVGPDQADWMAALAGWVEKGTKPATITATREARRQGHDDAAAVPASASRALQRPRRHERRRELRVRGAALSANPWEQENPRPRAARRGRLAAVLRPAGYRRAARASARDADRRVRRADDAVPDRRRGGGRSRARVADRRQA